MGILRAMYLRAQRRRLTLRALRKGRELRRVVNRVNLVRPDDLLLFSTVRNELVRLPFFLNYYRGLGINHFFFVDNNSDDGTREYLADQRDVSLWVTDASYRSARFGVDWLNALKTRYAHQHWVLVVDADEFLVYPHCESRPLRALTDWLSAGALKSFPAMLLDLYPRGPIEAAQYHTGQNPLDVAAWFDPGNYLISRNRRYENLWIQGGPRLRAFFPENPEFAPALNKIPLVYWTRGKVYQSSTHALLPRGLNRVYDEWGGEKPSGCLLHAKFLNLLSEKAEEEMQRRQHFARGREYEAYSKKIGGGRSLWTPESVRYENWRQLEELGLMSAGGWV